MIKKHINSEITNFKHLFTGDNCLHVAIKSLHPNRKQTLELLLTKDCPINDINKDLNSPLHLAAEQSLPEIIEILLKHGADINALDRFGQTALHLCAKNDNLPVCKMLLNYHIDTTVVSAQGLTALQMSFGSVSKFLKGKSIPVNISKKFLFCDILQKHVLNCCLVSY